MFEMAEVEHKLRQAESREFSAWRKRSEPCGFFVQIGFGVNAPFTNKRLKKNVFKKFDHSYYCYRIKNEVFFS